MPNLENLKKQAKLILRWHRERHYPVAAQIRELMPRFLNMPDSEILAVNFKLSDAQEMVARQHGFDSWQALKAGLLSARRAKSNCRHPKRRLSVQSRNCSSPISRDHANFSTEKLGFSLVFSYGNPPYYVQMGRDAARLNLRCVERARNRVDGPRS